MQEVISTGKGLIVVQPNFVEEFLRLQSKGARSGSAGLGGGVQSGAAIRDMTVGLVVVYFSSFGGVRVHVDCGARGCSGRTQSPKQAREVSRRRLAKKFALGVAR